MKKLLTVSVLAIMAVSAANADIASTVYVDNQTGAVDGAITYTNKNYINGATNLKVATESLDAAIKGVADTVSGLDNSGIASKIETALSEGNYVQEGDSLAVFDNSATGFVDAEEAVAAVEQAGYAKTANVVTNAELEDLKFSTTESGVVTSISQTDGKVAATVKKITDDEVASISKEKITGLGALASKNTVTQAEVDGLAGTLSGKQDESEKVKTITEFNNAVEAENSEVYPSVLAVQAAIDQGIGDKQGTLTPGKFIDISDNNVITTTLEGSETVNIDQASGAISVAADSIGSAQLSEAVDTNIAKGVAAHTAVTVPTITEGNPDGMYALTAKVVGGVVSGYSWEAIGR